ncbi:hypothetical protein MRX96_004190 [Rhipicephalus microplus]
MRGLRSAVPQPPQLLQLLLFTSLQLVPVKEHIIGIARAANPCELKGCPASKSGYINVHVLSHSHMDAGWLQTLDAIYETYATTIYDTTTSALLQKSSRRFVSAENVFFARWWRERPAKVKDSCGVPSVAWQADPFGHTVTQAALFARMGFSSVMLGRISFDTKSNWQQNRSMEFVWETDSREQGGDGVHILAWVPENTYTTPQGICFGWSDCLHPRGSVQAERATAATLIQYARRQADVYTNDTVAVMSGCDLCFADGDERFPRQDAILAKGQPDVRHSADAATGARGALDPRLLRGGLAFGASELASLCWRPDALHGPSWPHLDGLLLDQAEFEDDGEQAVVTSRGAEGATARVTQLGEAVATLQHHDGITGTSTDDVAHDYALMLYKGIKECELVIASGLVSMMNPGVPSSMDVAKQMGFCHLLNQSTCPFTENEREFSVLVYNPASVPVSYHVRLPIHGSDERTISVVGPAGAKVESQVVPSAPHRFEAPEVLGNNTSSLVFQVTVEPLGASLYHVKREPPASQVVPDFLKLDEPASFIENERFRVVVDPETGLVSSIVLLRRETTVHLRQTFGAYMFEVKAPGNMSPPGHYTFSAYREAEDLGGPRHLPDR